MTTFSSSAASSPAHGVGAAVLEHRFWAKVDASGGPDACWLWLASVHPKGYGVATSPFTGKTGRAHRIAYELVVGRVPTGLVIDHICRNRACVNPSHLEPVTNHENLLRGRDALGLDRDRCTRGHLFTPENTMWEGPTHSWRRCRTCQNLKFRRMSRGRATA